VLANWAQVDWFHLRFETCRERGLAAADLAAAVHDDQGEMLGHISAARALAALGELGDAQRHAAAGLALAERLGELYGLMVAPSLVAYLSMLAGEWERARALLERALAPFPAWLFSWIVGVPLEYQVGSIDAGERYLARLDENARIFNSDTPDILGLAFAHAFVDWFSSSVDHLDQAAERAAFVLSTPGLVPWVACFAHAAVALSAVKRRDAPAAAPPYEALLPLAGSIGALPLAIDHLLGLLAKTMGREETATGHFDAALAFCARAGYRPAYGWAAADYSDFLLSRDGPDDRARAVGLGNEALVIGRELGMRPLIERVLARREILKA
jgi:hypothetical protein